MENKFSISFNVFCLVYFVHQNVNSLCSCHLYINSLGKFLFFMFFHVHVCRNTIFNQKVKSEKSPAQQRQDHKIEGDFCQPLDMFYKT